METSRLRCVWQTFSGRPYFANLKVMRLVLNTLREELLSQGGRVAAYVFVDDRVAFVAEGPAPALKGALDRAGVVAEERFRASDKKDLWGVRRTEPVDELSREEILAPILRMPVEEGLASRPDEYPWAGGDWLTLEP